MKIIHCTQKDIAYFFHIFRHQQNPCLYFSVLQRIIQMIVSWILTELKIGHLSHWSIYVHICYGKPPKLSVIDWCGDIFCGHWEFEQASLNDF